MLAINEHLESGFVKSLNWIDTHIHMADPLTKHMDTTQMMHALASGY